MRKDEAEALAERRTRRFQLIRLWLWGVILPAVGLWLYFGVFAPGYHHTPPRVYPAPFSCQSEMASLAPIGGGGQIAPLCGATPYPSDPNPDDGFGAPYVSPSGG